MFKKIYSKIQNYGAWLSDRIASFGGSWAYICYFLGISGIYMVLNIYSSNAFDPYPFSFLNLTLGFMAALQAPFIMMADNRASLKDRKKVDLDIKLDKDTLFIITEMNKDIKDIKRVIKKL